MQEPNIQEVVCRALGTPVDDVTPSEAVELLRKLDARPEWLATVAIVLVEHVARTTAAKDARSYALCLDALAGVRLLADVATEGKRMW